MARSENARDNSKHLSNLGKSNDTIVHLDFSELNAEPTGDDGSVPALGIIKYCTTGLGYINQVYGRIPDQNQTIPEKRIDARFTLGKLATEPEHFELNTKTHIYIVQYMENKLTEKSENGKMYKTVSQSRPLRILRTIRKTDCAYIIISDFHVEIGFKKARNSSSLPAEAPPEEAVVRLSKRLAEKIGESHLAYSSSFPDDAQKSGILHFRSYAPNVDSFLSMYLPEYELKTNLIINGTFCPGAIIKKGRLPEDLAVFEKEKLEEITNRILSEDLPIPAEQVIEILREYGIRDHTEHAENISEFVDRFLPQFEIVQSADPDVFGDSDILILKEQGALSRREAAPESELKQEDLNALNALYEAGADTKLLSSEILKKIDPNRLPVSCLQMMINSAERLLYPENPQQITLNELQTDLLTLETSIAVKKSGRATVNIRNSF